MATTKKNKRNGNYVAPPNPKIKIEVGDPIAGFVVIEINPRIDKKGDEYTVLFDCGHTVIISHATLLSRRRRPDIAGRCLACLRSEYSGLKRKKREEEERKSIVNAGSAMGKATTSAYDEPWPL